LFWGCIVPVITQAFFSSTDKVDTLEQTTVAIVEGDFLDVTITQKIQGKATIKPLFALPASAEDVHFFVEGAGKPLEIVEGQERLELLFQQAKKIGRSELLRFGSPKWPYLFSGKSFTTVEDVPTVTKLKYRIKLDFLSDIFYAELPEAKGIVTLVVNRSNKVYHLLPICNNKGKVARTDHQIVWQGVCSQPENFRFYFSEVPNPTLTYKTEEATYFAHLLDMDQLQKYDKIHFIIDKSGSIYGTKWGKEKEVLQQILGRFPASKEIKVDFFDEVVRPFNETFVPNTRENQKKLTTYFSATTPLGKTDESFLEEIYTKSDANTLIVLLGDFATVNPKETWWKTNPKNPFVILSFGENELLALWTRTTGGFFLSLFESTDFVKQATFWKKFKAIFKPFLVKNIASQFPHEQEFLPYQQTSYAEGISNFFISRSFISNKGTSNTTASFLPRLWGQRKLGSLVRKKLREGTLSITEKEAIPSIAKVFGIGVEEEGVNNFKILSNLETPDVLGVLDNLRSSYFVDHIPYYQEGLHRYSYNFISLPSELSLQPFGEAQKQLFIRFPDIFAEPFAQAPKGGGISFCHERKRCITIASGGREQPQEADKLYWRGYFLDHWANAYIQPLAEKNIYLLSEEGNPLPDDPITRSEFVKMVVKYQYGGTLPLVENEKKFSDITDETLSKMVAILVEKGVIRGYDDGTFRPQRTLSRAEAVKILLAMNGEREPENYKKPDVLAFPDIGGWETFWVTLAKTKKMVKGYDNGNFGPHDALTRGQAAKLIIENFK